MVDVGRDKNIDVIKGVCIYIVVLGHVISGNYALLEKVIYSFHVPIFVLISGYLAKDYRINRDISSFSKFVGKRIRRLLVPYYLYSMLYTLYSLTSMIMGITDKNRLIKVCVSRLLGMNGSNLGPIWFLAALFTVEVIDFIIQRYGHWIMYLCIGLIGTIWAVFFSGIHIPLLIENACLLLPFFAIGRILKKSRIKYNNYYVLVAIILILASMFVANANVKVLLCACEIGNPILFWLESILGSVGVFGVLYCCISTVKGWRCKLLIDFGMYSLDIMAIHLYIYMPICILSLMFFETDIQVIIEDKLLFVIVWSVLLTIVSLGWSKVIRGVLRRCNLLSANEKLV